MITYNDIYEAAKRNPLVSFELPQSTERRFLLCNLTEITKLFQKAI